MQIAPVSNTSFGIRIKIDKSSQKFQKITANAIETMPNSAVATTGSSGIGLGTTISTGVPVSNTVGTAFDMVGSAFSAKASGIDTFGIVPYVIAKITPYATPATVATSHNNPEIAGGLFSTVGAWLHKHARIKIDTTKKIPS